MSLHSLSEKSRGGHLFHEHFTGSKKNASSLLTRFPCFPWPNAFPTGRRLASKGRNDVYRGLKMCILQLQIIPIQAGFKRKLDSPLTMIAHSLTPARRARKCCKGKRTWLPPFAVIASGLKPSGRHALVKHVKCRFVSFAHFHPYWAISR